MALVAFAPATLAVALAGRYAGMPLRVGEVEGSLWRGRAGDVEIGVRRDRPLRFRKLHWRLLPQRLLSGGFPLWIESVGDIEASGWLRRANGVLQLGEFRAAADLQTVAGDAARLGGWPARGRIRLETREISLERPYRGRARGELRLDSLGPSKIGVGVYLLDFEGRGDRLAIHWNGPQGPRAMSGTGWWDGRLHLDGLAGLMLRARPREEVM